MCAAYGWPPSRIEYADYVGLYLNRRRTMLRQAEAVANGIAAAFGDSSVEYFLATTDHKVDAERELARHRAWKAALDKHDGG